MASLVDPSVDSHYQRRLDRSPESTMSGVARLQEEDRIRIYGLRSVLENAKDKLQFLQDAVDDKDKEIEHERDLRQSLEEKLRQRLVDVYNNPALIEELHERLPRAAKNRKYGLKKGGMRADHSRADRDSQSHSDDSLQGRARGNKGSIHDSEGSDCSLPQAAHSHDATVQHGLRREKQQQAVATNIGLPGFSAVSPHLQLGGILPMTPQMTYGGQGLPVMYVVMPHQQSTPHTAPGPSAPKSETHDATDAAHGDSSMVKSAPTGATDGTVVKLISDHSRQVSRLLREIDALKSLNRKLSDELLATQRETESLVLQKELASVDFEAQIAARVSALTQEIYTAQRERDDAVMSRIRLANQERDEALKRLDDGSHDFSRAPLRMSTEENMSSSHNQDISELLSAFKQADSVEEVEETTTSVLELLHNSRQHQRRVVSQEMQCIIEERNAALERCKQLELEALQLHRALDDRASTETSASALKMKLLTMQQERDMALARSTKFEDELQTLQVYYSLHKSLSQEATLRDQYNNSLEHMEHKLQQREGYIQVIEKENNQLLAQAKALTSEKEELRSQLQKAYTAKREADDRADKLQRLVTVLQRKIKSMAVTSEGEELDRTGSESDGSNPGDDD